MGNYWIYTVTLTNLESGDSQTIPYFNRRVATSAFRDLCEQHGIEYYNVITREADTLIICKGLSYEYEILLSEEQIMKVI